MARVTVREVVAIVAETSNVPVDAILSDLRLQRFTRPRQVAMYLAHTRIYASYPVIGRVMDRDRATVKQGTRAIEKLIGAGDPWTCRLVANAEAQLAKRIAA